MNENSYKYSQENLVNNGYIEIDNHTDFSERSQTYISEYRKPNIITSYGTDSEYNILFDNESRKEPFITKSGVYLPKTPIQSDRRADLAISISQNDFSQIEYESIANRISNAQSFEDLTTSFGYKPINNASDDNILTLSDFCTIDSNRLKSIDRTVNKETIVNDSDKDNAILSSSINNNDVYQEGLLDLVLVNDEIVSQPYVDQNLLGSDINENEIIEQNNIDETIIPPPFLEKNKNEKITQRTDTKKLILEDKYTQKAPLSDTQSKIKTRNGIPFFIDKSGSYIYISTGEKLNLTEAIDLLEAENFRHTSSKFIIYVIIAFALSYLAPFFSLILIAYGFIVLKSKEIVYTKKLQDGEIVKIAMPIDMYRKEIFKKKGYTYIGLGIFSLVLFHIIF